jgi:hypothetical protein
MKFSKLEVERKVGKVAMTEANLLVSDITNMEAVEYWEDRLEAMQQAFVIAFRKQDGQVLYSIFADLRKKGSPFR